MGGKGGYLWWGRGGDKTRCSGGGVGTVRGVGGGEEAVAAIERDVVGTVWVGGCGWRGDRGAVGMGAYGRWEAL